MVNTTPQTPPRGQNRRNIPPTPAINRTRNGSTGLGNVRSNLNSRFQAVNSTSSTPSISSITSALSSLNPFGSSTPPPSQGGKKKKSVSKKKKSATKKKRSVRK